MLYLVYQWFHSLPFSYHPEVPGSSSTSCKPKQQGPLPSVLLSPLLAILLTTKEDPENYTLWSCSGYPTYRIPCPWGPRPNSRACVGQFPDVSSPYMAWGLLMGAQGDKVWPHGPSHPQACMQSNRLSRVFSSTTVQKYHFFGAQPSLWSNCHIHTWLLEKPQLWLHKPLLAK